MTFMSCRFPNCKERTAQVSFKELGSLLHGILDGKIFKVLCGHSLGVDKVE